MDAGNIDVDAVRDALSATRVLEWAAIDVKPNGRGQLQSSRCPRMEHRASPRAFVIDEQSGRWKCFACSAGDGEQVAGDLFDLIAERERLKIVDDFPRVKAIAADIAGVAASVPLSVEEAAARQRERAERVRQREAEQREATEKKRVESIPRATAHWEGLLRRHARGEAYLEERGVGEALSFGIVRFKPSGSPAIALRTSDGRITDVIERRLPELAPTKDDRFRPIGGCYTRGTYVNALSEIVAERDVVMVEGFFDAITATLAWRSSIVIGARHAEDLHALMPHVAKVVAARRRG